MAVAAVFVFATDAVAHGALKASVPAPNAHVKRVPREIRLTFNEAVERRFTRIALVAADGRQVALGPLTIPSDSPVVAIAAITGAVSSGVYTVQWQMAGPDGHPVRGTFAFTVVPGAVADTSEPQGDPASHHPPAAIPVSSDPEAFDAESPLYVMIRWLTFVATFLIIGAVAFRYSVIGRLSRSPRSTSLTLIEPTLTRAAGIAAVAAGALLVIATMRLYAQSVAMHSAASALDVRAVGSMVIGTLWGKAWLLQVAAAISALAAFAMARRGSRAGWGVAALSSIGLAASLSLSGHAPATPRWGAIAVASDMLHVIGAAGWLGSLVFVLFAGITVAVRAPEASRGAAVADLVKAFSPAALAFAAIAAITGTVSAALHLAGLEPLWTSTYGRTLILKLAILSVAAGTGAYNWLRVRPALGDDIGTRRIRRSATVEIVVAAMVLAVTAVLVATATP